ncbi:MAG: sulfite reductase subunit C, partial [Blautia sp.]
MDINTKKLKKNAFRVSKVRGMTASRVRVPGGLCNAEVLKSVAEIAEKYGNGTVHITTRQGFEIEGIHMEDMEGVNEMLQPIIANLGTNQEIPGTGY